MTEKLIVQDFAGIKYLEIDVKKINVIIGPQASGKSICAKLLFYFKSLSAEIPSAVSEGKSKAKIDSAYIKIFEDYFPSESWGEGNFCIRYEISDVFFEITRTQGARKRIAISYSEVFRKTINKLRLLYRDRANRLHGDEPSEYKLFLNSMEEKRILGKYWNEFLRANLCDEITFRQLFIPAGRSFFAHLQSNIFSFLSGKNEIDSLLMNFGSIYENSREIVHRGIFDNANHSLIKQEIKDAMITMTEELLCGKYIHEKGKDFLDMSDGRRVSITNASSGQQEILPLTIVLTALPIITAFSDSGQTAYIEEPEAHLFPSAQRSIVELMATVFNSRKEKLQFFVTTHSPYILTAINNLLQAGLLYQEANQDIHTQAEKILPAYKTLNSQDLSAYVLEAGESRSIFCPETGLIDATLIDSVSEVLATEFDQLLDLT